VLLYLNDTVRTHASYLCRPPQVSTVNKAGLYNPYTMSGEIVVNGMLASCHSDWVLDPIMPARYAHLLPAIYQVGCPCWRQVDWCA
jgi:Hint module